MITTLKAIALWLLILGFAVANGGLREVFLLPALPRYLAFTVSGILLIACVLGVAVLFIPWLGTLNSFEYLFVGMLWLALTLGFEFSFGLLVRGESLSSLFEAYRFKDGNIWPLVLVAVVMAPLVGAIARRLL